MSWRGSRRNLSRVFDPLPVGVLCQCTRDHIGGVLSTFSDEDLTHMIVDGQITVTCEFCNKDFVFDPSPAAS